MTFEELVKELSPEDVEKLIEKAEELLKEEQAKE